VAIGSAGSGGPALERFLSPAGYQNVVDGAQGTWTVTGTADVLPLDATGGAVYGNGHSIAGNAAYAGLQGTRWFLKDVADPLNTGNSTGRLGVRGFAPYFEAYDRQGIPWTSKAMWSGASSNTWAGIQSLIRGRKEAPGWFAPVFMQWTENHLSLDIDHVNDGSQSPSGIACTMPLDMHYVSALIPPGAVLFQDGYQVPRNNIVSQFANWVILDEIYRMYRDEAEASPGGPVAAAVTPEGGVANPELYLWRNGIWLNDATHGAGGSYENNDKGHFAQAVYKRQLPNAKFRQPPFPIDDPQFRFDFYKMEWGAPGHPSIAERVRRWITVENGGAATSPRKAMDSRGLIDNPEQL
jgi:hypothetical protein